MLNDRKKTWRLHMKQRITNVPYLVIVCSRINCHAMLFFIFFGSITSASKMLAVATDGIVLSLCMYVGHDNESHKNSWTNRDAVKGIDLGGPKEPLKATLLTINFLVTALYQEALTLNTIKHKWLLVQSCRQSHVLVCLSVSVCLEGVLWHNSWLDLDAVWSGEWGRSKDGCIRWGWILSKGKEQFWGKCWESHCNQWRLCGIVIFCCERWQCGSSQTTLGFLVT